MMFMVLFGSLAVAMAVVSKGNLRTAQTHLRVSGALGATDSGMTLAEGRLAAAATRLRVWKGDIDAAYAQQLWDGNYSPSDGPVLNPAGDPTTLGLRDILAAMHPAAGDPGTVAIQPDFIAQNDWLVTAPIVLEAVGGQPTTAFQITYVPEPITAEDRLGVRVMVTGFSWDFAGERWTRRSAQRLFRIDKNPKQAVLGPSKIMIGKNVQINGPIGARFTDVGFVGGHPMVVRGDFFNLDPLLDTKLDQFYAAVLASDTDGDNRLRTQHDIEKIPLDALRDEAFDDTAGGQSNGQITDFTGDGFVDEYDIFLKHYDANGDGRVALSDDLRAGTPNQSLTAEFAAIDDNLAILIDHARPDRNADGVVDSRDTALGYADGVVDFRDRYAKIRGQTLFRAQRPPWEAQDDGFGVLVGDYQRFVAGVIAAGETDPPVVFNASDDILPPISTGTFDTALSDLGLAADGAPFAAQVGLPWITQNIVNADGVVVGQTLNPAFISGGDTDPYSVKFEPIPFGAPAPSDYYNRPVIRDRVFRNVVIPMGTNALFENCTFVGVTRVETIVDNTHPSWQFYGVQESDGALAYPPLPAESPEAQLDTDYFPQPLPGPQVPPSGVTMPPRLTVSGTPYVTTKPLSNNIRFHNCTFVGSIIADRPDNYTHLRNKLQFTGATRFSIEHPDEPLNPALNPDPGDIAAIKKSSMMLPHYSVDIGKNNASPDQNVDLRGLIIAGVMDVRGRTEITGALLLTFEPSLLDPALMHFGDPVGNPADFNGTFGYFGAADGDAEGLAPFEFNGQTIVGFDTTGDGEADSINVNDWDGSNQVVFNGFGRIVFNFDPSLVMPDGLIAPLNIDPIGFTYHEGRVIAGATP